MKSFLKKIFILFLFTSCSFADELMIEPDAGRAPLLNAINHANTSIDLAMYGLTDETFIHALVNAKNNDKKVNILLEPAPYKSNNENNRAIHALHAAKIDLRWPDKSFRLIHQKTFIFDNLSAIVMTFNLTHGSFTHERNFALTVTDPEEVREIKQVFDSDFQHKNTTVTNPHLFWSPENSREKMLRFIQSAKNEIKIYAQDITDYRIIGALGKEARQGVSVKILVSVSPEKFTNGKFSWLKKSGVIIHNTQQIYIHAKVMMIDQKRAVLGSINFTKPSLDDNRELSVMTEDPSVIQQLNNTFNHDWSEV